MDLHRVGETVQTQKNEKLFQNPPKVFILRKLAGMDGKLRWFEVLIPIRGNTLARARIFRSWGTKEI